MNKVYFNIFLFCMTGCLYGMEGSGLVYKNGHPTRHIVPATVTHDKETMSKNTTREEYIFVASGRDKQRCKNASRINAEAQQGTQDSLSLERTIYDLEEFLQKTEHVEPHFMRDEMQSVVQLYRSPQALFLCAAKQGDIDALRCFCSQDVVDVQDKKGNTALILVSQQGHYEAVKVLLERGAAVNKQNNKGRTALFKTYNASVLKLLLGKHAAINHQDHQGNTALMIAVRAAQYNAIQCLVEHRASKTIKNKRSESVLDVAESLPDEYKRILLQDNSQISLVDIPMKYFSKRPVLFKTLMTIAGVPVLPTVISVTSRVLLELLACVLWDMLKSSPGRRTFFIGLIFGSWNKDERILMGTMNGLHRVSPGWIRRFLREK